MKMNRFPVDTSVDSALAQPDRVHQELLHVGGERVEEQGAAHGQTDDDQHFARMSQQQGHLTCFGASGFLLERIGLDQIPTQIQRRERGGGANGEGNAPAPRFQLMRVQHEELQHHQHGQRQQLGPMISVTYRMPEQKPRLPLVAISAQP